MAIERKTEFVLTDAAWTEFVAMLDRPVSHKPRLENLFAEPSIFGVAVLPPDAG